MKRIVQALPLPRSMDRTPPAFAGFTVAPDTPRRFRRPRRPRPDPDGEGFQAAAPPEGFYDRDDEPLF